MIVSIELLVNCTLNCKNAHTEHNEKSGPISHTPTGEWGFGGGGEPTNTSPAGPFGAIYRGLFSLSHTEACIKKNDRR